MVAGANRHACDGVFHVASKIAAAEISNLKIHWPKSSRWRRMPSQTTHSALLRLRVLRRSMTGFR